VIISPAFIALLQLPGLQERTGSGIVSQVSHNERHASRVKCGQIQFRGLCKLWRKDGPSGRSRICNLPVTAVHISQPSRIRSQRSSNSGTTLSEGPGKQKPSDSRFAADEQGVIFVTAPTSTRS